MYRHRVSYFAATSHPWACFVFLLPLLLAYEVGVLWMGGTQPAGLRNGADSWLRWGLEAFGLHQLYWLPVLVVLMFLSWSAIRQYDRPPELLGVWMGMAVESAIFAVGLWGLSRGLGPLLDSVGVRLNAGPGVDPVVAQVISFVGAGIYEEVLFRLLLFSALGWLLWHAGMPGLVAFLVSALTSALLFSGAHHFGPYGEKLDGYVFLFRTLAGLYFALLYQLRGFGITVGAHAGYDVLVGLLVK
jgi:hypothetical protein